MKRSVKYDNITDEQREYQIEMIMEIEKVLVQLSKGGIVMTYENWREAIRQEYTIMVSLSYYLNGAGHTRMKTLGILYLLSEQCETAEQLLDRVDQQDLPADDLNLIFTRTGYAWVEILRTEVVSRETDCD